MTGPVGAVGALIDPKILYGEVDAKPQKEDTRFFSVTTIIGSLSKDALIFWSATETAKAAIRLRNTLVARVDEEGEEAVIKHLADARYTPPPGERTAADLGTTVHAAIEEYSITGCKPEVDDEVQPFLDNFDRWAQLWQPVYEAAEASVYSDTYGYAGTLDAIVNIDGQSLILDYKTSKKSFDAKGKRTGPYPEAALQLAAYRHAEMLAPWQARRYEQWRRRYYLLNDDEREIGVSVPEVDGAAVLHITPEHADLYPVRTDETVFKSFLYVIEAFRWTNQLSKTAIGERLTKGGE